jgi:hypothetical protein
MVTTHIKYSSDGRRDFRKNAKRLQEHHQQKPVFDENLDIHVCKGESQGTNSDFTKCDY